MQKYTINFKKQAFCKFNSLLSIKKHQRRNVFDVIKFGLLLLQYIHFVSIVTGTSCGEVDIKRKFVPKLYISSMVCILFSSSISLT